MSQKFVGRLWPLIPKLAALPSAAKLKTDNSELDRRVAERTLELEAVNARLVDMIQAREKADAALAAGKVQTNPIDARIIRVNKAFADMLGYSPDELMGRQCRELTAPDDVLRFDLGQSLF